MRRLFSLAALCSVFMLTAGCVGVFANMTGGGNVSASQLRDVSDAPSYVVDIPLQYTEGAISIPPRKTGTVRVYGYLSSVGPHNEKGNESMSGRRGGGWTQNSMAQFGMGGDKNAWFFADIDPATNEIVYARAYFSGYFAGSEMYAHLGKPYKGSYGKITKKGWEITVQGRASVESRGYEEEHDILLTMRGKGDILALQNDAPVEGNYVLNLLFPPAAKMPTANWKQLDKNGDHGFVKGKLIR